MSLSIIIYYYSMILYVHLIVIVLLSSLFIVLFINKLLYVSWDGFKYSEEEVIISSYHFLLFTIMLLSLTNIIYVPDLRINQYPQLFDCFRLSFIYLFIYLLILFCPLSGLSLF
jgi:Zn-dependent protease with chaperone function